MACEEVDAVSLGEMFDRVAARATADRGRPLEELGAWPVVVAVVEVLAGELREALLGQRGRQPGRRPGTADEEPSAA